MDWLKFARPKLDEKNLEKACDVIHERLSFHVSFLNNFIIRNFLYEIQAFIYVSGLSIIHHSHLSEAAKSLLVPAWQSYNVKLSQLSLTHLEHIRNLYVQNFVSAAAIKGASCSWFDELICFYVSTRLTGEQYEEQDMLEDMVAWPPSELLNWVRMAVPDIQDILNKVIPKFRNT